MNFENDVYTFIKELEIFEYKIESIDHILHILFPNKKGKWNHVRVTKYNEVYYIDLFEDDLPTLEVTPNKSIEVGQAFGRMSPFGHHHEDEPGVWKDLIIAVLDWLKVVKKDWIKANKLVQANYPLNRRMGYVPNSLIRASLSDIYRIDKELGKAKTKKFISLVESNYFHDDKNTTRKSMTANDFFEYCKIAYIAGCRKDDYLDESLSGREMYERYADGRHEGLLDIAANSKKAFADWIDGTHPKKSSGGHPWEIKRGGNTTHIDLYVTRPSYYLKEGFKVSLAGASIGRLKETICMFLGIYDAKLPISINNPEGIRKRLLAQDNVGIIPCYQSLHRANQHFREDEDVFDVLHYDELGRYKTRIKPFITWEPLPILKPKGAF
jgi:hypothetical protein